MAPSNGDTARWFREHRAMYNRWADRHTILIWCTVAVLIAFLVIIAAAMLTHPLPPLPDVSGGPTAGGGKLG